MATVSSYRSPNNNFPQISSDATPKINTSVTNTGNHSNSIPGPIYQNQFSISVDCESPGQTNSSMAVYKITINHFLIKKEPWFVLQHYSSFERLMKFLKEDKACKNLLKQYNAKNLPKKPSVISFFSSLPDYVKGVTNFVAAIFSEKMFLNIREVQIFFAIDKYSLSFVNASQHEQNNMIRAATSSENENNNNILSAPNKQLSNNSSSNTNNSRNSTVGSSGWNLGTAWNRKSKPSDFEFLKVIGKGSFGKVLLAQHKKDSEFYAVKVLNKQTIIKKNEQGHIMAERNVLTKNLSHPFLVSLHYSFQTAEKLYFVLDYLDGKIFLKFLKNTLFYANGGELFFHLQKERVFSEPRARFYAAEIGSAIGYMHDQDILYRDLKPENLLLDREGHVVLTDFGLCKEFITSNDTTQTFCGTPEYLAPEVLRKEPYSKAIDWWCYGSVLYEMLYGLPPFYSKDSQEMYRKILNQPLAFKSWASSPAKDILSQLLQKDPRKRMGNSIDDFQEIKAHHFFREIDWEKLLARHSVRK